MEEARFNPGDVVRIGRIDSCSNGNIGIVFSVNVVEHGWLTYVVCTWHNKYRMLDATEFQDYELELVEPVAEWRH